MVKQQISIAVGYRIQIAVFQNIVWVVPDLDRYVVGPLFKQRLAVSQYVHLCAIIVIYGNDVVFVPDTVPHIVVPLLKRQRLVLTGVIFLSVLGKPVTLTFFVLVKIVDPVIEQGVAFQVCKLGVVVIGSVETYVFFADAQASCIFFIYEFLRIWVEQVVSRITRFTVIIHYTQ